MKKYLGPAMWVLVGALLGGGGVYTLGVSRAQGAVHVGAVRPADMAELTPADGAASPAGSAAASNALAAHASSAQPVDPAARAAGAGAPVPGAAPQAPRPEGDRLTAAQDPSYPAAQEHSSAFQADAAAAKPEKTARLAAVPKAAAAPASSHIVATAGSVRYGLAGRSELMGRGAGPVYNLKAPGVGQPGDANSIIKQVGTIVQTAEQQLDQANMDPAARAALKKDLQNAASGVPAQ